MRPRAIVVDVSTPGAWEAIEAYFGSTVLPPIDRTGWKAVYGQISQEERGRPTFVRGKKATAEVKREALAEARAEAGFRAWERDPGWPLGRYAEHGLSRLGEERFVALIRWALAHPEEVAARRKERLWEQSHPEEVAARDAEVERSNAEWEAMSPRKREAVLTKATGKSAAQREAENKAAAARYSEWYLSRLRAEQARV